jgi:hypothetical protein
MNEVHPHLPTGRKARKAPSGVTTPVVPAIRPLLSTKTIPVMLMTESSIKEDPHGRIEECRWNL